MADQDGLQRFLDIAAEHGLLTAGDERALGKRVQSGTLKKKGVEGEWRGTPDALAARNTLVTSNVRLVVSIARYYRNRGLAMDDVMQEGIRGLHRAAEKFDPTKNIRFSTYATLWIKQAIQRALTSSGTAIRLPSTVSSIRAKVRGVLLRHPDADATFIADLLSAETGKDIEVTDVQNALDAAEVVTSLDREIVGEEHTHTMLDAIPDTSAEDPHDLVTDDLTGDLRGALGALERNHRRVIEMHFGLTGKPPLTVSEVAVRMGVTVNTVKTLRAEAMEFIGHRLDHHR